MSREVKKQSSKKPIIKEVAATSDKKRAASKRAKKVIEEMETEESPIPKKATKRAIKTESKIDSKKPKVDKAPATETKSNLTEIDFGLDGKVFNHKISSWNVAGLRAWVKKDGLEYIEHEKPDIFCLQETKCHVDQLPEEAQHIPGYHPYWHCHKGGYAGVALYSKAMPMNVEYGLNDAEQDVDARILTAEYEKFYLVNAYVPNAGNKLVTLPKRLRWNKVFDEYITKLDQKKPVIICGDMNVAHEEIDLANPKTNKKNAGFTQEERDGMTDLLALGFVDTFRHFYPNKEKAYTFWSFRGSARSKNVGWRLDYFISSERLVNKITDSVIRTTVNGSDHCPITLFLNL